MDKPIPVLARPPQGDAMQFTGDNAKAIADWLYEGRWVDIWLRQRCPSPEDIEDNIAKPGEAIWSVVLNAKGSTIEVGVGCWIVRDGEGNISGMNDHDFRRRWVERG